MKTNTDLKTISETLFNAKTALLFPHKNPDGDSVGACSALSLALRAEGVECYVYADEVPKYLHFINREAFTKNWNKIPNPDVCVAVDCNEYERLQERSVLFDAGKTKICIDHHEHDTGFGDLYYIDPKAAAACELVYEVLKYAGAKITRDIANALYTGIVTDTGSFRYSNTRSESYQMAKELFDTGVDHTKIMVNLYNNKDLKKVRCENKAIARVILFAEGKGAISYMTSGDMGSLDAHPQHTDEIIDRLRDIDGVEMAAYLEEREDGIKVSMRSKTDSSVLEICQRNGGGGHVKSAGCTMHTTLENAFAIIKEEMEETLRK
ncbi:MAG: bifunctional oligoribonuclease/PAP phosphatase NrnA [Clostridia bacterium]|nr:bifunctional oligoribonuclease/PAP phosphatase NrnA [Clostridia bacterium]